jgi:hypothetical protein
VYPNSRTEAQIQEEGASSEDETDWKKPIVFRDVAGKGRELLILREVLDATIPTHSHILSTSVGPGSKRSSLEAFTSKAKGLGSSFPLSLLASVHTRGL